MQKRGCPDAERTVSLARVPTRLPSTPALAEPLPLDIGFGGPKMGKRTPPGRG